MKKRKVDLQPKETRKIPERAVRPVEGGVPTRMSIGPKRLELKRFLKKLTRRSSRRGRR